MQCLFLKKAFSRTRTLFWGPGTKSLLPWQSQLRSIKQATIYVHVSVFMFVLLDKIVGDENLQKNKVQKTKYIYIYIYKQKSQQILVL